jgi:hypothetical protein
MLKVPNPEASPAANWTSAGRIAAAVTLVLAAAFPLASHLMGPPNRTIDALHWVADHPDLANLSKVFDLLAVLLAGRAGSSDEALRRVSLGQQSRGSG